MRCRPGDLAVVVSACHACNIGKVVHVLQLHDGSGDIAYAKNREVWLVRGSTPLTWTKGKKRFRRKTGPVPDVQLQPIRRRSTGTAASRTTQLIEPATLYA